MGQAIEKVNMIVDGEIIKAIKVINADMSVGKIVLEPVLDMGLYYKVVEELMGAKVENIHIMTK